MVPHAMALISKKDLLDSLPDLKSAQTLNGLDGEVLIYRDNLGIPHARARTQHDAFFAQGFFSAQDRLWQMDWDRHRAYGRSAEWLGVSAIEQDTFYRRMGLQRSAKADYDAVDSPTKEMLDAYSSGVNAFITTTDRLPVEYRLLDETPEPWLPWDGLSIFKVRHLLMGTFEFKLWRARLLDQIGSHATAQLFPIHTAGDLLMIPTGGLFEGSSNDTEKLLRLSAAAPLRVALESEHPDSGSNSWALAASKTSTGGALLAGDSHRLPDTPNVYYQNQITCPEFDVIGLSFAGLPGFHHFGHNGHVAWCVTHTAADYQDLFLERFNPTDTSQYEFKGEWIEAKAKTERLKVRGAPSSQISIVETHHGPVVFGDPRSGHAMAIRYTATVEPGRWPEAILKEMLAVDVDEFEAAQSDWVDPCNNLVSADVHGNISYLMRGKLPVRSRANAWAPVPGWNGQHEWESHVPFTEAPRSRNPEQGYLVTANNRVIGTEYPHYIAVDFVPDFRARALNERLGPLAEATVSDMESLHATRQSLLAKQIVPFLVALKHDGLPEAEAQVHLASWDFSMDRDAIAPTIYSSVLTELVRLVSSQLVGPELTTEALGGSGKGSGAYTRTLRRLIGRDIEANDTALTGGSDWNEIMKAALSAGITRLRSLLGNDQTSWKWGELHRTRHAHPLSSAFPESASLLNPPSEPVSGDGETPLQGAYIPDEPFTATSISVTRYVYDPANWRNSRWVVPLGASGHPGSPHFSDQLATWSALGTYPMLYDWADVASNAESNQRLLPL